MSCVTTIPDPSSGSAISSDALDLLNEVRSGHEHFRIVVLVPVNIGDGMFGKYL